MAVASQWWATPADPAMWFSASERERSASYHRPLHLAGVGRAVSRMAGLLVAQALADDLGRLALGCVVVLAWWVPGTLVEAWHEYRHEPRFGSEPLPATPFLLSSLGVLIGQSAVVALLSWVVVSVDVGEALMLTLASAIVLPWLSLFLGPPIITMTHGARPVSPSALSRCQELAASLGVSSVSFLEVGSSQAGGPNAFATGSGRRAAVCVAPAFLASFDTDTDRTDEVADHIVAHELAHLRRRHGAWAAAIVALLAAAVGCGVVWLTWELTDGGARLPLLLILAGTGGLLTQPLAAWASRVHERRADLDAADVVAPDVDGIRALYLRERTLLDPSRLARVMASHPAPAERLELLRRATGRRI